MEIQYSKMLLYGLISALFYIGIPLILIYVLDLYNIMTFSQSFITAIIVLGCIGVFFSMLKHAFPKDTSANRLVALAMTIYSGVFLFYIFGGFEPGVELGTYYINTPLIQVLLGLQIIAWLFLGSTIIRGIQYLIEAIELRKKKEYRVKVKKEFRLSRVFKALGILATLAILGYFGSIIFSAMNLKFNLQQPIAYNYDYNLTPLNFTDDSLSITLTFNVSNMGLYAIRNVSINAELFTDTTDNASALPWHTKIGGIPSPYQKTFHSFSETPNQNITISILSTDNIKGLITTNANLLLKFSFSTIYAWIYVNLNVSIPIPWTHP